MYYQDCRGGTRNWQYVLTTYLAAKPLGASCVLNDDCASQYCNGVCEEAP